MLKNFQMRSLLFLQRPLIRSGSTLASSSAISSSPLHSATATQQQTGANRIPWNDYFKYRQQRNKFRPIFGIPAFALGTGAVVGFVPFNPVDPILGIDPSVSVGLCAVLCGLFSYQAGGSLGQMLWRLKNRSIMKEMDNMDALFFKKIVKYRAQRGQSPYIQNTTNLFKMRDGSSDDYYGERIKSVHDYRSWLSKQRKLQKSQAIASEMAESGSKWKNTGR